MKSESIRLNPLALANQKLAEARSAAKAHVAQIQYARAEMERNGFTYPATASPAETARLGAEWESRRVALRNAAQNFDPVTYALDELDKDVLGSKALLEAALTFLEGRHKEFVKATKPSLLSKLTTALKPPEEAEDWPPKREPVRGIWGQDELPPIEVELAAIAKQIRSYPEGKSFPAILTAMNAANSRLELPADKPKQAVRQDKGFVVHERPSPPQPHKPYTHPLPIDQTGQTEAARRSYVITGA
jgi:hypothetical protein